MSELTVDLETQELEAYSPKLYGFVKIANEAFSRLVRGPLVVVVRQ